MKLTYKASMSSKKKARKYSMLNNNTKSYNDKFIDKFSAVTKDMKYTYWGRGAVCRVGGFVWRDLMQ